MDQKTLTLVLVIGAVAAGGYLLYRHHQNANFKAQPNPEQRDPAKPRDSSQKINEALAIGNAALDLFEENFGGY